MKLRYALALLSLLFLGACSGSGTVSGTGGSESSSLPNTPSAPQQAVLQPGDYNQTITVGSDLRSYILHVPTNYDGSKALPLVFVLHGGGGTAGSMVHSTQMNLKADQENFIVAYLQAVGDIPCWNTQLFPYPGTSEDDEAFVLDLLTQLETQLKVDGKRVYVAGFSNGAMMTHLLAAKYPDVFAGVAIAEGTIGMRQSDGVTWSMIPNPQGPIPVLLMHGIADETIPYDGGQGIIRYVKSVADAVDFWTVPNGCAGLPQENISSDGNVVTEDYTSCVAGGEVKLVTIKTGIHEWPSLSDHAHFAGTDAAWEFFANHSKL